jgi:hypothetical protein
MRLLLSRISAIGLLCALCSLVTAAAAAQEDAQEDAADDRATSFQAVQGAAKEDLPGGPLLLGAYGFVLVLVVGYAARLGALQAKTSRELERLTKALEGRGKRD